MNVQKDILKAIIKDIYGIETKDNDFIDALLNGWEDIVALEYNDSEDYITGYFGEHMASIKKADMIKLFRTMDILMQ